MSNYIRDSCSIEVASFVYEMRENRLRYLELVFIRKDTVSCSKIIKRDEKRI